MFCSLGIFHGLCLFLVCKFCPFLGFDDFGLWGIDIGFGPSFMGVTLT